MRDVKIEFSFKNLEIKSHWPRPELKQAGASSQFTIPEPVAVHEPNKIAKNNSPATAASTTMMMMMKRRCHSICHWCSSKKIDKNFKKKKN